MYHSTLHHPLLAPPSTLYLPLLLLSSTPTLSWPSQHVPWSGPLSLPEVQLTLFFDLNFFVFIWLQNFLRCCAALLDSAPEFSLRNYYYYCCHWTPACVIFVVSIIAFVRVIIHGIVFIYQTCFVLHNNHYDLRLHLW